MIACKRRFEMLKLPLLLLVRQDVRHIHAKLNYEKYYRTLGVENTADQSTIREAYIELVKKVHPDSGLPEASDERFKEVNEAFKMLLQKQDQDLAEKDEFVEKDFDIRHTTPQHRAYLTYDGIGSGSPLEREKQYHKRRTLDAQENIYQFRVKQSQASETSLVSKNEAYKVKIYKLNKKPGIEAMVEDLIQESMSKGDFNNLKGFGKPLKKLHHENPYIDFTTQKINNILIDNGFTPEWITLQKDIRKLYADLKKSLQASLEKQLSTENLYVQHADDVKHINKLIDKFNLIVPILNKQMFHIKLAHIVAEVSKELEEQNFQYQKAPDNIVSDPPKPQKPNDIISLICSIF